MSEQFLPHRWIYDSRILGIRFLPAGMYDTSKFYDEAPEGSFEIPYDIIPSLITFLDENGFIKPRLDTRLREEDLKITHRLFDLLEKK